MKSKFLFGAALALLVAGCSAEPAKSQRDLQTEKAAEAAESVQRTSNVEIDNIKRRLELTSKPGAIGFILLLNEAGQPIMYTAVKGKVTSSGKRLTRPYMNACSMDVCFQDAPSDEGVWGSSDPYIYFWDTAGRYHQWSGKYLYSDQPIRTRVEPLVISTE